MIQQMRLKNLRTQTQRKHVDRWLPKELTQLVSEYSKEWDGVLVRKDSAQPGFKLRVLCVIGNQILVRRLECRTELFDPLTGNTSDLTQYHASRSVKAIAENADTIICFSGSLSRFHIPSN